MPKVSELDIRSLATELADLRSHPGACARLLAETLADWLNADLVDIGRRTTRTGPGTFAWLPVAEHHRHQPSQAQRLQRDAFFRHPDFCLPMSDALITSPLDEASFIASRTAMPLIPRPSATLLAEFLDWLRFADSITLKSAALAQPNYVGWLSIKRLGSARPFTEQEHSLVLDIHQRIAHWFWAAQRRHLDDLASMDPH